MSLEMIRRVFADKSIDTHTDRLVMLALANCHNSKGPKGGCFPTIETVMELAQVSRAAAYKSLDRLVKSGKLKIISGIGRGNPNQYELCYGESVKGLHVRPFTELTEQEKVSAGDIKGLSLRQERSHPETLSPRENENSGLPNGS
jgi:hypothetical protein